MRGVRPSLLLSCAAAAAIVLPASAGATTSGGHATSSYGPLSMTRERAFVPSRGEYASELGAPVQLTFGIRSISPAFGEQVSVPGAPVVATNATTAVAAWGQEDGVHVAALDVDGKALVAQAAIPVSGVASAPGVAVDAAGNRLVAWIDDTGLRAQRVGPDGALADAPLAIADPTRAVRTDAFAVSLDAAGPGWLGWASGGRLWARRAIAGAADPVDLGPVTGTWAQRADGAGGLWSLAPSGGPLTLEHLAADGTRATFVVPAATGLLAVDGADAVVAYAGRGRGGRADVFVARYGAAGAVGAPLNVTATRGAAERLRGLAVSPDTGRAQVLVRRGRDAVLVAGTRSGTRSRARLLARRAGAAGLAAAEGGLVAVWTTRQGRERENEDGGGSNPDPFTVNTIRLLSRGHAIAIDRFRSGTDTF